MLYPLSYSRAGVECIARIVAGRAGWFVIPADQHILHALFQLAVIARPGVCAAQRECRVESSR